MVGRREARLRRAIKEYGLSREYKICKECCWYSEEFPDNKCLKFDKKRDRSDLACAYYMISQTTNAKKDLRLLSLKWMGLEPYVEKEAYLLDISGVIAKKESKKFVIQIVGANYFTLLEAITNIDPRLRLEKKILNLNDSNIRIKRKLKYSDLTKEAKQRLLSIFDSISYEYGQKMSKKEESGQFGYVIDYIPINGQTGSKLINNSVSRPLIHVLTSDLKILEVGIKRDSRPTIGLEVSLKKGKEMDPMIVRIYRRISAKKLTDKGKRTLPFYVRKILKEKSKNKIFKEDQLLILSISDSREESKYSKLIGVGTKFFTLFRVKLKRDHDIRYGDVLKIRERNSTNDGPRIVKLTKISYKDLTNDEKEKLPIILERIIEKREEDFLKFFNNCGLVTPTIHALDFMALITKQKKEKLLKFREKRKFWSLLDIWRYFNFNPIQAISNRVLCEHKGNTRHLFFVNP